MARPERAWRECYYDNGCRYLFPTLTLLVVSAVLGWLIFAKVFAGYTDLGGYSGEHFKRGWPIGSKSKRSGLLQEKFRALD